MNRYAVKLWDELTPGDHAYISIHTDEDLLSFIRFWSGKPGMVIEISHRVDSPKREQ